MPSLLDLALATANVVVLAPHSDDAAYCVPGFLRRCRDLGYRITLITCFSRTRYAPCLLWRSAERVTRRRKSEDAAFISALTLNAHLIWLDWPDALLRPDHAILGPRAPRPMTENDYKFTSALVERVHEYAARPSLLLAPLGIGLHVDHRIVREAAFACLERWAMPLFLYEDLPYAAHLTHHAIGGHLATLAGQKSVVFEEYVVARPDLMAWKRRALLEYRSQVTRKVRRLILNHASRLGADGGERLWFVKARGEDNRFATAGRCQGEL